MYLQPIRNSIIKYSMDVSFSDTNNTVTVFAYKINLSAVEAKGIIAEYCNNAELIGISNNGFIKSFTFIY